MSERDKAQQSRGVVNCGVVLCDPRAESAGRVQGFGVVVHEADDSGAVFQQTTIQQGRN